MKPIEFFIEGNTVDTFLVLLRLAVLFVTCFYHSSFICLWRRGAQEEEGRQQMSFNYPVLELRRINATELYA